MLGGGSLNPVGLKLIEAKAPGLAGTCVPQQRAGLGAASRLWAASTLLPGVGAQARGLFPELAQSERW